MPKSSRSIKIPVIKGNSVRQMSALVQEFSSAKKKGAVSVAAHRRALNKSKTPRPYTLSDRVTLLTEAGFKFKLPTDDLHLSVRYPYAEGSCRLYFFNVSDYYTDQDRAALFMSRLGGGASFPSSSIRTRRARDTCSTSRFLELQT